MTDALVHEKDPMWHQYYRLFKNDLDRMEAMTEQKKAAETAAVLTQLEQRYLLIRPALFIRHDPSEIERLDSLFVFLKKQANPKQMAFPALQSGIKQLDELIDILFGKKRTAPPTCLWPMTGSRLSGVSS
ncbi:sporulation protein YpjB [Paenibacillus sp. CC-CFT747]|nr:sporulation protein YpjB [Paenibacillus sp. CC-CFT747]